MKRRKRPDADPDIAHEPHLRGDDRRDAEHLADRADAPPSEAPLTPEAADPEHAAVDEPALAWAKLDRKAHGGGYREHLDHRRQATSPATRWVVVAAAALAAGPWAIFGALYKGMLGGGGWGLLAVVVVGPVIEEVMKIAVVYWLVERKPWLLPGSAAIVAVGALAGLSFGAIENLVYLHVYFPDAGPGLAVWRWSVTMPMHAVCSTVAAVGVAVMWRQVWRSGRPADVSVVFPWLVTAIVMHGAYNAMAVAMGLLGMEPGT